MPVFYDQMMRRVELEATPRKIVSLVPSQTELLFDLGLDEEIIGVTRFCIYPRDKVRGKRRIGRTKDLDLQAIKALEPDLILGNKEENERGQIEALARLFPVWISDVVDLTSAIAMIKQLGEVTGKTRSSERMAAGIMSRFSLAPFGNSGKRVLYLIWRDPFIAVGKNTFIDDMIGCCGFRNTVSQLRYPAVSAGGIGELDPDVILLSSEPYPFKQRHVEELSRVAPRAEVVLVDGEMFSWYGSRLLQAAAYFRTLAERLG